MRIKKVLSALLAFSLVCSFAFAGCSKNESNASSANSSSASSDTTSASELENKDVKILTNVTGGKDEEEMKLWVEELNEKTGLNVTMEKPADYDNAMIQKLMAGEKYDLVYMTATYMTYLVSQSVLKDVTSEIKASSVLMDPENIDPQEWEDIALDGKYYAGFNKKEVHLMVTLNNAHLKKAGIDYKNITPTLDGYYDVFKKLKETYSSVSGYYPYNVSINSLFIQPWMAAAGIKGGVVTVDGKNTVPYASDEAAPVWEWLAKLYDEGLLDPDCLTDTTANVRSKVTSGNTSVVVDRVTQVGFRNNEARKAGLSADEFEMVSLPGVQTPDGKYMLTKDDASLFAVPVNAPNVEGAVKVLEFFASPEGGLLLSLGVEGHDYTVDNNGGYTLTEIGQTHGMDHGAYFPISKKYVSPIAYNEGVEEALTYAEWAAIEQATPLSVAYSKVVGEWAVKIVKGTVSVSDGLASMREALKEEQVISE